jgi:cystathionine beta-lyase
MSQLPGSVDDPFGLRSLDVERLRRKRAIKWSSAPPGGYAAWIADMDFHVAPAIGEALRRVIDADEFGYPDWGGVYALSPAATQFAVRMAERYAWEPDPSRLHDMCNVIQCVRVVVQQMSVPGDGVVLHMPAYHPFLDSLATMDRRLVAVEPVVAGDGSIEFDYDRLDEQLATARAKVWILCHPHNPTGHVFDRLELERIAEIAARHDLTVIADEVHADLTYASTAHTAFASLGPAVAARTVTTSSASKAFNLAGMRWAVLHAGSDELHRIVSAMPGHYLGAPNKMAVEATLAAWTAGDEWLEAVRGVLDENRRALTGLLAQHLPGARYHPPEATYLTWIDLNGCDLGDDPGAVFAERGVLVSPGLQFGPQGAGHVRLNIATSPAILAEMVKAMAG